MTTATKRWYIEAMVEEISAGRCTIDQVPAEHRAKVAKALGRSASQPAQSWTLGKWKHPVTGELRLYVNSRDLWRGSKVWFTSQDGHAVANTQAAELGAKNAAQKLADEVGSKFAGSFEAMLASAK